MNGQLQNYIVNKIQRLGYYPKVIKAVDHVGFMWDVYDLSIQTMLFAKRGRVRISLGYLDYDAELIDVEHYSISLYNLESFINNMFDDLYDPHNALGIHTIT